MSKINKEPSISLEKKIEVVNEILKTFGQDFTLLKKGGTFYLQWKNWRGKINEKRWHCLCNFYPSFHHQMATSGTATVAIANLVKYCQGQNVYPLSVWQHWAKIGLWADQDVANNAIKKLKEIGYPVFPTCVFCGVPIQGRWDWFYQQKSNKAGVGCIPSCQKEKG